jgi:tRNA(fMet)-specific endonuclease VapC
MTGRVLLDTNAVIALLAGDKALRPEIVGAEAVFVSTTVLGELYYGAAKSTRVEANLAAIDKFAQTCAVLLCTTSTARIYGQIKAVLKTKGTLIPENDLWIAAVAWENGLTVVTRDDHFGLVEGLAVTGW